MDKTQATELNETVKGSDDHRRNARILLRCQEAVLDQYSRLFAPHVFAKEIARTRELMRDVQGWIDGGPVPASAVRYVELQRAMDTTADSRCKRTSDDCKCAECSAAAAMMNEYYPIDHIGDATQTCLELAARGDQPIPSLESAIDLCASSATDFDNGFSELSDMIDDAVHRAAEQAAGGANALEKLCAEPEKKQSNEEFLLAVNDASANAAVHANDGSLFWLFPRDERGRLPESIDSTAQRGTVQSRTARRLQILMAEACAGGVSVQAYLGTLVEWAAMLLKRLPADADRTHRSALANAIELSNEIAHGSRKPAVFAALEVLKVRVEVEEWDLGEPSVEAMYTLAKIDWSECGESFIGTLEDGWAEAADMLYNLAEVVPANDLEPVMQECAATAHRNLFATREVQS